MPARACRDCQLVYPADSDYRRCLVCSGKTKWQPDGVAPSDWESRVEKVIDELGRDDDKDTRQLLLWRTNQLWKLGVPWEIAIELAGRRNVSGSDFQVNLHDAENLIKKKKCPPLTAARILG